MATTEIKSAAKATEIARAAIKKYRVIARPLSANREDDTWIVELDVGPIFKEIAKVKIDAKSGEILSYNIPK